MSAPHPTPPAPARAPENPATAARKQIRGSSLLLSGKLMAVGTKFVAQVLVVRYLSTSDYGAWAYALAAVSFLGGFAHLSLNRSVSRFAAIYHEREQYDRFFGIMVLVLGTILLTGSVFIAGLHLFPDLFERLTGSEETALSLLFVMILLVPLEALDTLLISIFATFSRPRAIFVRRYVITPFVQLGVVLLLLGLQADILFLAYGYVGGTLFGVLVSAWLLYRILVEQELLSRIPSVGLTIPAREVFSFSVPMMSSDWLKSLTHSSGALVLGYFHGVDAVALLRVVVPVAVLNQLVMQSFHLLYVPHASRMFSRGDRGGINDLYWQTSLWIAVLTFPVFAVTLAAATPLTVLLFGARYEASGLILSILAVGQYAQACLGFNGSTLTVLGKVRYILVINLTAAVLNVALTFTLVPMFGAVGAAAALSATMIAHNILKQTGLAVAGGFTILDSRYAGAFGVIALSGATLVVLRVLGGSSPLLLWTGAAGMSLAVLLLTRRTLRIGEAFPEIGRIPLLRVLFT